MVLGSRFGQTYNWSLTMEMKVASAGSTCPWQKVNEQHGLRGWTLGEIYGIGDDSTRLSPLTQTGNNIDSKTTIVANAAGQDSGSDAALQKSTAQKHRSVASLPVVIKTLAQAERYKLTPDQACDIFRQQTTKTAATAALLATQYGISPKSIRDIWTKRSWANETRPYWPKVTN